MAFAALAVVAAACGFEGSGSMPAAAGVDETGTGETGAGPAADGDADGGIDGAPFFDEGGTIVLLDSATLPAEEVDAGDSGACPVDSYRCAATGACVTVCGGCPGASLRCAASGTCVDACTGCAGRTFECWACSSSNDAVLAKITCEPSPDTCYGAGFARCDCARLGGCYGSEQICLGNSFVGYACRGCGEPETNGRRCVGSGPTRRCNTGTRTCN